jgi:hypothetical protein
MLPKRLRLRLMQMHLLQMQPMRWLMQLHHLLLLLRLLLQLLVRHLLL